MTTSQHEALEITLDEHIDGRTMRRTRNRAAVISALLELIEEGDLHPAATEIARRAGVSHRSIFRYFDDLDDLVRTAIDQVFHDSGIIADMPRSGSGTRSERIARFVDARIDLYIATDGAMQVARMRAPKIPSIDEGFAKIIRAFKDQIAHNFADELDPLGDEQRSLLIDGMVVLTSYDSYTIQRRLMGSDDKRIRAATAASLDALLPT